LWFEDFVVTMHWCVLRQHAMWMWSTCLLFKPLDYWPGAKCTQAWFLLQHFWRRVRNLPIFLLIFWSPPDKIVVMQCSYCFLVCCVFATLDSFTPMLVKYVSNIFLLKCNVYVGHPAYNIARSVVTLQHSW